MQRAILGLTLAGLSETFLACAAAPPEPSASAAAATPATREARPAGSRAPAAPPAAPASGGQGTLDAPAGWVPAPASPPPIPPRTAVLLVGDSFTLAGFAQALRPRMKALGARYEVKSDQSSYTVTWAAKMERLIANHQPDLVIITLGANEVANTDPPAHAPAVRRIVKSIGDRPCVWVSPPLWRKDTGIIDVIREHSAPCRFFDSDALVLAPIPRQSDKIHPTEAGGAVWAEAFWRWLEAERAPAPVEDAPPPRRSPWALKPAPPEEHRPRSAPR